MADTAGQQPKYNAPAARPVSSDIPASQLPSGVSSLPNATLPNASPFPQSRGASAETPLTPTASSHGSATAPAPAPVASTPLSGPSMVTTPMIPSVRILEQTPRAPVMPPQRTATNMSYNTSHAQMPHPSYPQQPPFPHQPYPAQPVQQVYQGLQGQQGYQHPQAARPLIVDPPRRTSVPAMIPPQPQQPNGFPSPGRDYALESRKFTDDLSRIGLSFQQGIPEAVRRGVRDNWEKCLLGSEFHQAFILNAAVHHSSSTPSIQSRAIRDFGAVMVSNCKQEIVEKWSTRDIDDIAPALLAKASNAFLDQCLAMRLQTIDAKPLIQALAKAERLGYEPNDILLSEQQERVIPNSQISHAPRPNAARLAEAAAPRARPDQLQCLKCFRTFNKKSYFDYHISRSVCTKVPPTAEGFRHSCPHCGQGFTHVSGMSYHTTRGVCEPEGFVPEEPAPASTPATPVALPDHMRGYTTPSLVFSNKSTASPPGMRAAASPIDRTGPYAHLTSKAFKAMQEELRHAEIQYAPRFHEAEAITDPEEKQKKLDSLRNTFGTKQSIIRKKYGVRLRERRTKAEIQAERERMGLGEPQETQTTPSAQITKVHSHSAIPVPSFSSQQQEINGSPWTAANNRPAAAAGETSAGSKRRRLDDDGGGRERQSPSLQSGPTTKVSQMSGGLTASVADPAVHDPALPPTQRSATTPSVVSSSQPAITYEQSGARVEVHLPSKSASSSPRRVSVTPVQQDADRADVMDIDSQPAIEDQDDGDTNDVTLNSDGSGGHGKDGENENQNDEDSQDGEDEEDKEDGGLKEGFYDSDSDSDDEDIPPTLPVSTRPTALNHSYRLDMDV